MEVCAKELDACNFSTDTSAFESSIVAPAPPLLCDESSNDNSSVNSRPLLLLFKQNSSDTSSIDDSMCDGTDSWLSFTNANANNFYIANSMSSSVHHTQDAFNENKSLELSMSLLRCYFQENISLSSSDISIPI